MNAPIPSMYFNAQYQIKRARSIARSLGYKVAARYLKRRGWSLEATLWILCRTSIR